jgi:hypothetical protein
MVVPVGRRRNNGGPIEEGTKPLHSDLDSHERDQGREKNRTSDQVSLVDHDIGFEPGHGDHITAGFAKGGGKDLDEPEAERDFGDFGGVAV